MYVHIHTQIGLDYLNGRLEKLRPDLQPRFGKMTCHQMICHISDLFRVGFGTIEVPEFGTLTPEEVKELTQAGKTVPVPKGFDQHEGEGTRPTVFEEDVATLKRFIDEFNALPDDHVFCLHPYFYSMDKQQWTVLINYHINYHLEQFGV
jgi:hypothetical protein